MTDKMLKAYREVVEQEHLECMNRSAATSNDTQRISYEGGESTCIIIMAEFDKIDEAMTSTSDKPDALTDS